MLSTDKVAENHVIKMTAVFEWSVGCEVHSKSHRSLLDIYKNGSGSSEIYCLRSMLGALSPTTGLLAGPVLRQGSSSIQKYSTAIFVIANIHTCPSMAQSH